MIFQCKYLVVQIVIERELDKSRKWTVDEVNQIFNLLTSPGPQVNIQSLLFSFLAIQMD